MFSILGLCPHLHKCKEEFRNDKADELLGRCVQKYMGLECSKSSKVFTHSIYFTVSASYIHEQDVNIYNTNSNDFQDHSM